MTIRELLEAIKNAPYITPDTPVNIARFHDDLDDFAFAVGRVTVEFDGSTFYVIEDTGRDPLSYI